MRLVGLDVGTSSTKGLVIDETGAVLAEAERAYPLASPRPGWAEQDPEDWWRAAEAILAELRAHEADGIGLTGQMHGLVVLGADDRPLRPAILWNDGRSQPQCDAIEARLGVERLVALSGNRALAGFTAPKLLWLAEHEPDTYNKIRHVLLPKDYVRFRLCGERATDVADASGTLLLDVGARAWSTPLLEAFGVDPAWLPRLHESVEVSGTTRDGVPIAAGAGDQAAGALGMGVVDAAGPASIVLGTSGVVFAARDGYAPDPQGRLHAFCHAVPDAWHVMGVELSAAGALRWLRDATSGPDGVSYDALTTAAARWAPGVEGLRFAPYLTGERTPHADADVRAAFVGLGLRHDRGALVRAVLEGVAHGLADGWDLIDPKPALGRLSGGGARSELWTAIVAATLDVPLERTASNAGAAFGAALLGGVAGGTFADVRAAVAACVAPTARVDPDPELVAAYAAQRAGFAALYPLLRELPGG
ncbi:Xylulose kinase [Baekduia alba]|uniref:xylulokinase n=1 Tax=Baekduia alba TaxID=2997333 RepID=UPI00234012BC|nr:xylulokinase [Baekduia alba]WCB96272.1 Xylulose kinase [Baekduia alba]